MNGNRTAGAAKVAEDSASSAQRRAPRADDATPPTAPARAADLHTLLARVALGDRAAFRSLYDATQRHLFPVARRITRNESWADEVLQESYMTVWHRAATFDAAKASPMTWMTTIVRNRALDRLSLASARHETSVPDEDIELLFEQEPAEGLGAWSDDAALCRRLRDCLGRLQACERQSVALAYLNGMSHSEVASHLGRPLGSVKGWIRRAVSHLKDCLDVDRIAAA